MTAVRPGPAEFGERRHAQGSIESGTSGPDRVDRRRIGVRLAVAHHRGAIRQLHRHVSGAVVEHDRLHGVPSSAAMPTTSTTAAVSLPPWPAACARRFSRCPASPTSSVNPADRASASPRPMSFSRLSTLNCGSKSPAMILGPSSRKRLLTVAAPLSTTVSKKASRSRPSRSASANVSHVAALMAPNIRLFSSFSVFPWPDGPTWTTRAAMTPSTGSARRRSATSPPTGRVQAPTPRGRPSTGASR